jgi:GNAT superfamily N-acetyltransferase/O-methyltransferase involved in polyketide biosynthesis
MSFTTLNQTSPVAKTAFDSIQAKRSAQAVGRHSMVVENVERYKELLERVTSGLKTKPQTPLVNAGYACRVLAVSHSVNAFIKYHQHIQPNKRIQIIFMGCGIDILGLWSRSLVPRCALRVVELDVPSVCSAKKVLLEQHKLVKFRDSDECGGCAGMIESETETSWSDPDYVLRPVDLRVTAQLDLLLRDGVVLDPLNAPTLVISELVLSYLDRTEMENLLTWCSSNLISPDGSAMLAVEPLGFDDSRTTHEGISVWDGYRRDYCKRFHSKMERGNAPSAQALTNESEAVRFYPIGASAEAVVKIFENAGYGRIHANNMGSAAAHASASTSFHISEIFDEHAALVMHLRSYLVITAFSHDVDGAFERLMCPASYAPFEIPPLLGSNGILYTTITPVDDEPMKEIYRKSHEDLTSTYSAVRKMVQGILNREFAVSTAGVVQSEIAARYTEKGGCFFVAISYSEDVTPRRSVVGCLGVKLSERKDATGSMEVFRLAVEEKHWRKGIGRQLLQTAEAFARSRNIPKVFASTITNLENAMHLYEACGYHREGDTPLGALTMRTYSKNILI